MRQLVVLEKIYGPYRPEDFTPAFLSLLSGLAVSAKVVGTAGRGWLVLELSGEDEEVAARLLEEEIGLAPEEPSRLSKFSVVRGRILTLASNGLLLDIGAFRPVNLDAFLSLDVLRSQLADGLELSLEELSRLFCLLPNLPLEVKLVEDPSPPGPIGVEFSEAQVRCLEEWVSSGLDRLVVVGASYHVVKRAISSSGLYDKVVEFYRLGLLEHCIILKLGVSPRMAIRMLRRRLKGAKICMFRPLDVLKAIPGRYERLSL